MKLSFVEKIILFIVKNYCPHLRYWIKTGMVADIDYTEDFCEMLEQSSDQDGKRIADLHQQTTQTQALLASL